MPKLNNFIWKYWRVGNALYNKPELTYCSHLAQIHKNMTDSIKYARWNNQLL